MISRPVMAVERASPAKMAHFRRSLPNTIFASFHADLAMIATTAAPIP